MGKTIVPNDQALASDILSMLGYGTAANIPAAANVLVDSLYYETDTKFLKQEQAGVWVKVASLAILMADFAAAIKNAANGIVVLDASGDVPLAQLAGITNTEIAAAAAIAYSKLNLTGAIKAADIEAAAGIPLTKLEAEVCSETEAAGLITTHDGLAAPHSAAGFARLVVAETEVFNGAAPAAGTWTDLDLTAVVGATLALVFLRFYNAKVGAANIAFRPNGETEYLSNIAHWNNIGSIGFTAQGFGLAACLTDAAGILEWITDQGLEANTTIDIIGYIK